MKNNDNNPKDEKITNDDNAITNQDELKKRNQPTEQNKPDDERVPTVIPGNDSGDPGPVADEDSSDKGSEGENL